MCAVQEGISSHLTDLQRFARSLVGPNRQADADDLVQSCVLRALEKAEQFQEGTNLKAWLFTLMRSLFISDRRHDQVCRRHAEAVGRGPALISPPLAPESSSKSSPRTSLAMAVLSNAAPPSSKR